MVFVFNLHLSSEGAHLFLFVELRVGIPEAEFGKLSGRSGMHLNLLRLLISAILTKFLTSHCILTGSGPNLAEI
jgi:predicted RNA-binding protein YlqC (UPF0109 family)